MTTGRSSARRVRRGMFATRRVVFLRDIARASRASPSRSPAYAASPGATAISSSAPRGSTASESSTRLLGEAGVCLTFPAPNSAAGFKELIGGDRDDGRRRADSSSKSVRSRSCWPRAGPISTASPPSSTSSPLWLGSGAGRRTAIDVATVRELVAGSVQLSGWELADALTERDAVSGTRRRPPAAGRGRRADPHRRRARVARAGAAARRRR